MSEYTKERTKLFLKNYGVDLARAIQGTGLYFAGVVGQKCGESGYGTSKLAVNYNNFGGLIYGAGLQGATGKTSNGWAIFKTPYDCFMVYVRQLQSPTKLYTKTGVFKAKSPEEQIKNIIKGGYCAGTTPEAYLRLCQGAVNASRDICGLGKIDDLQASIAILKSTTV